MREVTTRLQTRSAPEALGVTASPPPWEGVVREHLLLSEGQVRAGGSYHGSKLRREDAGTTGLRRQETNRGSGPSRLSDLGQAPHRPVPQCPLLRNGDDGAPTLL